MKRPNKSPNKSPSYQVKPQTLPSSAIGKRIPTPKDSPTPIKTRPPNGSK